MRLFPRFRLAAVVVAVAFAAGCMGSFTLTKKVYGWNETVTDSKIINNVIFWALAILPVYDIAFGVDVIILNTIEFWTGNKLFADAGVQSDSRVAIVENADGTVTVTRGDDVFTLSPWSADRVQVSKNGVVVGTAEQRADGTVVAADTDGINLVTASEADVAAVAPAIVAATN